MHITNLQDIEKRMGCLPSKSIRKLPSKFDSHVETIDAQPLESKVLFCLIFLKTREIISILIFLLKKSFLFDSFQVS